MEIKEFTKYIMFYKNILNNNNNGKITNVKNNV